MIRTSIVKKRIRGLYRRRPPGAAVVCFDEWGPLEIKPIGGVAWARRKLPRRMRATYHRLRGTEQFFGFYDVHADCLDGLFRKQKRLLELFEAFRRLRRCYPGKKLFVILDILHHLHDNPRFLALLRRLKLQELGSWESVEMVRRYAHLSADHLASYVDRVSGLRPVGAGEVATLGLQSPEIQTAS